MSINIHASGNQKSKAGGCKEEESLFGFWKNCNSGNTNLGNPESKSCPATTVVGSDSSQKALSLRTHRLFQDKSPESILSFWKVFWMAKDLDVRKSHFLTGLLAPWQRALSNTNAILIFPIIHCTTEVWSKQLRGKKNLLGDLSGGPVADSLLPVQGPWSGN